VLRREAEGWAPLYRCIFRSTIWKGQQSSTKAVAVWIIGNVRHTDSGGTPAGSVDTTQIDIANACDLTRDTARSALVALREVGFVQVQRLHDGVRISVVDWEHWLRVGIESPSPARSQPSSAGQASLNLPGDAGQTRMRCATIPHASSKKEDQDGSDASHQVIGPAISPTTRRPGVPGYTETIDVFHRRYLAAYGQPPTWRAAEGSNLKRLLAAHGAEEVQRRIAILFESPPRWLTPPFSFGTLVANFDRLVVANVQGPGGKRGGLTPGEILQHAARRPR
jgi:hypothetical protein